QERHEVSPRCRGTGVRTYSGRALMKTERGASQVLFGMLPLQTVDLQGGVWRVKEWTAPIELTLDQDSVRRAIIEAVSPWTATKRDDGLADELYGHAVVEIVRVDPKRGVAVESFP